jgi:hypothetical protein
MLLPALVPKFQLDFCVQASPETAAGALLEDAELDEDDEGSLAVDVVGLGSAVAAGLLGTVVGVDEAELLVPDALVVTAAVVELPVDELDVPPDSPHPTNKAVPARLPNNEITRRRCTILMSCSASAALSV